MDFTQLPFEADAMLKRLKPWIECESPTFDAAAVDRMMDLAATDFATVGATIERIPGRMGLGGSLRARFGDTHTTPGILVSGHLDTVHPVGTLNALPFRIDDKRAYGPGILDMKGGNFLVFEAMRQLLHTGIGTRLPVTVLLTPDEEIGTPSTRDLIEAEARRNKYVLVPEPAREENGVVTGRYAIARYNLVARGRPSHAGVSPKSGRSAIREMARKVIEIDAMSDDDCTFSVGVIHGGQWVNCVSSLCTAEALSMAKTDDDLASGIARMLNLSGIENEVEFSVTCGVTRPVWPPARPETMALYEKARMLADSLGVCLPHGSSGGGSDGNFTGALGIATLCGLGLRGAGYHTLEEHIEIDSLVDRGRLMAGLLATLD
ncbi:MULTISPECIES: M20/M25/M40 family metallo-hydrolase [Agrobacterium]|jgi:glutamate carboxypeptidase|uniref:Glutamate carboxypeptidase n=1 Tax=Agrobacterium tumefaciens TaxID=358 RepID=A0AAW8M0K0_AGRTU|nr:MULTISPECIES: M20/M25/M40 family metallo-hydrolase [Agrobacterium]MBP2510321.1 glutamate carboxypeptidase [Agrobacterium tumefaciens]MBP2519101.1 glutamate carboxypeptidase [Agrobacterium tumefaciens]MBP2542241.1 glutamate carboxypeptidase [Agrobacterium tumefaciens]MBP2568051.1 glutamate carboxypeptidase [Agrobacterium tumefaciens]MBP2573472.1 glutamate carboxypeptidase [Agrobacterium tumefaciens]